MKWFFPNQTLVINFITNLPWPDLILVVYLAASFIFSTWCRKFQVKSYFKKIVFNSNVILTRRHDFGRKSFFTHEIQRLKIELVKIPMKEIVIYIDSSLDDLIEEIVNANNRGVSLEKNGSAVPSWSFGQSFFFSSTVVTTIGKIFFEVFWRSIIWLL